MTTSAILNEQQYRELSRTDPDRRWEFWDGVPVEKPPMSMTHNIVAAYLGAALISQLDRNAFRVNVNGDRVRGDQNSYFVPDVIVIPAAYQSPFAHDRRAIAIYADPLPLVVESWSPSTGHYDLATELAAYRLRGDLEIWYIHPYEQTLTAWCRQPDGSDSENLYTVGMVPVLSLPGVQIDFDTLLEG